MYEKNTVGTSTYIYGPYGILAKRTLTSESHTFYYHTDHLGSTRLVTDENKNIVTAATYEPSGESTVTGSEPYLYTGKEKDSTDLSYYGARYYDSELGRFITRDLLAGKRIIPQSLNLYTYCLNNPVKSIDPSGLDTACYNEGKSRVCIDFYENGQWAATGYYNGSTVGVPITDSDKIEQLMKSINPADRARAVYLMLLVTHPSIQGDPTQNGTYIEEISDESDNRYSFNVIINGEEYTLFIGISEDYGYVRTSDGKMLYASADKSPEKGSNSFFMTVYQGAFSSVAALFHIIGHEGVHILDMLDENASQDKYVMETRAYRWERYHSWLFPWPFGKAPWPEMM